MTQLDSDTSLTSCTTALISATSAFAPGSSNSSASGDVTTALSTLCSSGSSQCSETTVRSSLVKFYAACQSELTTNLNQGVLQIYDVLYTIIPLTNAVCSKDTNGNSCAKEIPGSPPAASSLYSSSGSQQVVTPNFATIESSNAAFLFLQPTLSSTELCTPCTRSIITSYVSFESDIPYGPGLAQSIILNGQTALYQAVQTTCGASFLSGVVQAAGSLSNSIISNSAASSRVPLPVSGAGAIASLVGVVTVALAAAL